MFGRMQSAAPLPALLLAATACAAPLLEVLTPPEPVAPGVVCSAQPDVRFTVSPDGRTALWGSIEREGGRGGFDVWQATRSDSGWSDPRPASFSTDANEFDPAFSADGLAVLFFSDRPGGLGGDDLWSVACDPVSGAFGEPVNLGAGLNTAGDEWAPGESPDGSALLFCSNGRGGAGGQDLFVCRRAGAGWGEAENLSALNSPADDFDAAWLPGGTVVFARGGGDDAPRLFAARPFDDPPGPPEDLGEGINRPDAWNFGPSAVAGDPGALYFTTRIEGLGAGRSDVFRVEVRELGGR